MSTFDPRYSSTVPTTAAVTQFGARPGASQRQIIVIASANNPALRTSTATACPFHGVGTARSTSCNSHSPNACTYRKAGPGWWNPTRE